MRHAPVRALNLPPPGRPNWSLGKKRDWDLLYVAWGRRRYGDHPIPVSLHDGWAYLVVLGGTPSLVLSHRTLALKRGDAVLIGPDCAYGLSDRRGASCNLLSWIWRKPPHALGKSGPGPSSFAKAALTPELLKRLSEIHALNRVEAQSPDTFSSGILDAQRQELDVFFARALAGNPSTDTATAEWRLHLALEWLNKQPGASNPVESLCDYLQVSPSTLGRLFRRHLGCSPKTHIHRTRMEYALRLRKEHYPVKEIAGLLGYQHANDLSRALSSYRKTRKT